MVGCCTNNLWLFTWYNWINSYAKLHQNWRKPSGEHCIPLDMDYLFLKSITTERRGEAVSLINNLNFLGAPSNIDYYN